MEEANRVTSTDNLDLRTNVLELFAAIIGPKVAALAADLADLRRRLDEMGTQRALFTLTKDVSRLKASLRYPTTASDYDTDWYLDDEDSDVGNVLTLGYDAKIEEGLRFPDANADQFEISLFSANDSNAAYSNGLLLPKYTEVLRVATSTESVPVTTLGIAQYGYQTTTMEQGYMSRSRLRYGGSYYSCSNANVWNQNDIWGSTAASTASTYNPTSQLYDDGVVSTRFTVAGHEWYDSGHNIGAEVVRYDDWWFDTWNEPFMYAVTTEHVIVGAFVAQTVAIPNDIWATSIKVYISAKGANEDIHLAICETLAGVPEHRKNHD